MSTGDERAALLGNETEREQRKAALTGVERSAATGERLERTQRTALESAATGEEILNKLHDQREKILSARASAGHMERDMDKSERRMTQLSCEKCVQRWAFCFLVTLVLGGLSFFLWWKLQHRDEEDRHRDEEDEAMLSQRLVDAAIARVGSTRDGGFFSEEETSSSSYRRALENRRLRLY